MIELTLLERTFVEQQLSESEYRQLSPQKIAEIIQLARIANKKPQEILFERGQIETEIRVTHRIPKPV